jgi:hypothetical protein
LCKEKREEFSSASIEKEKKKLQSKEKKQENYISRRSPSPGGLSFSKTASRAMDTSYNIGNEMDANMFNQYMYKVCFLNKRIELS